VVAENAVVELIREAKARFCHGGLDDLDWEFAGLNWQSVREMWVMMVKDGHGFAWLWRLEKK
jgi:hypothetical protein